VVLHHARDDLHVDFVIFAPVRGGQIGLFALKAVTRAPIAEIIVGVAPYVLLLILGLALVMFFPAIALWLPGTMNFR
jgi:C4-dicarboxylate transporter DctM subunit